MDIDMDVLEALRPDLVLGIADRAGDGKEY